jgi:ribosome-associated translation inhibitor RaiA
MHIQVYAADSHTRGVDHDMVRDVVGGALDRFAPQITRVEVHVRDVNGPKQGAWDKECTIEARLAGRDPVAVTAAAENLLQAVNEAAEKLKRRIESDLGKLKQRR